MRRAPTYRLIRTPRGLVAIGRPLAHLEEERVRSSAVKPLSPVIEQSRLDKARENIKQARAARNYPTPVNWFETGKWGASTQPRRQRHW
jgi:hypothetical protein